MSDLAKRLGGVLRSAQDQKLGRRAVRAGLLSQDDLQQPNGGIESMLRRKGVTLDQIRLLQAEIDREDFALFRPDRPPPPEVLSAGTDPDRRLAEFVLVSRLGQGGIGEVWKAWDTRLGRWVAVKLPVGAPDQDGVARRFTREALAAAKLSHPNIVSIYRVAEEGGRTFIVMQYIEGRILSQARLGLMGSVEAMRTVSLAVHYAHEHGVIHRDLKPGNIIIAGDGRAVVLDFGLAHLDDVARGQSREGLVAGTAAYMSPEQARGEPGARARATDIYSLGATLYEVATGRPPYDGNTFAETLEKVLYREPATPRSIVPSIPRDLEVVILKAIDKDPHRRYGTARELAEDLERCLRGEPVFARPTSITRTIRRGLRRHPRVASVVAALATGILLLLLWGGVESRRDRERRLEAFRGPARVALQAVLALRHAGANEEMMAFSPDLGPAAPEAPEVESLRGRLDRALLDDARALKAQERALALDPSYLPALYERLVLLARRGGRFRDLILEDAGRLQGLPEAQMFVVWGIKEAAGGNLAAARTDYERAIGADASLEEAWEGLARVWISSVGPHSPAAAQEEACREAEEILGRAIERDRGFVPHWVARGRARSLRGQLKSESGGEPEADFQAAEDDFGEALRRRPSAEAWIERAWLRIGEGVHAARGGEDPRRRFVEAEGDLAQALRADPGNPQALGARCRLHRLLGETRVAHGESVAVELEAVERESMLVPAWLDRAVLFGLRASYRHSLGEDAQADWVRSESLFEDAIRADAGDPEVWERRAFVRFLRRGGLGAAEADATRAIQMSAFFPRARLTRARIERALGRKPEALRDLEDAMASDPSYPDAWAERGELELEWGKELGAAGDRGAAREHLVQSVRHLEEASRSNPDLATRLRGSLREAKRGLLGTP
jgi:serine/threonine protein kinase